VRERERAREQLSEKEKNNKAKKSGKQERRQGSTKARKCERDKRE
jgi:hypothetical protein